jgi:hypothetical protein
VCVCVCVCVRARGRACYFYDHSSCHDHICAIATFGAAVANAHDEIAANYLLNRHDDLNRYPAQDRKDRRRSDGPQVVPSQPEPWDGVCVCVGGGIVKAIKY